MSIQGDDGFSGIPVPAPGTYGALGDSKASYGAVGISGGRAGVYGESNMPLSGPLRASGVVGVNDREEGVGVRGRGFLAGVYGEPSDGRYGVGVQGVGGHLGVKGIAVRTGVHGDAQTGVVGVGHGFGGEWPGYGVRGYGENIGVYAVNTVTKGIAAYLATQDFAADFQGKVRVNGAIVHFGGGFLIDHPLDPANKYLHHSSVESPDRKTVYDGIAVLDGKGGAVVELPEWFGALNRDFRYQLTCLGGHAPVFVAEEIEDNRFRISGGSPGLKVSWQVTGIRQDPWANANAMSPEQDKPEAERGSFLCPTLYGEPEEKSLQSVLYPKPPESPELPAFDKPR